jgi:catechol 2,3-dioxygenase-like lactoylglutathione lyase family enzyme
MKLIASNLTFAKRLHPSIASLGEIMQLAFVPADIDAAVKFWVETMGAGPFYALDHITLQDLKYMGRPTSFDMSALMGYWGDMQIELIHQHDEVPSIFSTWRKAGYDGLHHVCALVKDMNEARTACAAAKAPVLQECKVRGGEGEIIYVDTGGGPGTIVELYQPAPASAAFFKMIRDAARGWDGSNPVRRP